MEQIQSRSKTSIWLQAARPFSFTASALPIIAGAAAAYYNASGAQQISWLLFPIILVAGVLIHAATNMVSEYFDYKKGVDRSETFGSSRVLVENIMAPKKVLIGGYIAFAIGFILGMILVYYRGMPILILGLIGIAGGIFYTGKPIGFKYLALGDLLVFILMGPLMVVGSYYALAGEYSNFALYVSLPIGCLVAAILIANNIRDIKHDREANIKTFANVLGIRAGKIEYLLMNVGAFIIVGIMIILGIFEIWAALVIVSIPICLKNVKLVMKAEVDKPELIAMADVMTAQFHMVFGLLLSIGLVISKLV